MKTRYKIPLFFLLAIIVLIGGVYLLLTRTNLFEKQINTWVNFYLQKNYPLKVEIGGIQGSLIDELILSDVSLVYTEQTQTYTLVKSKRLDLKFSLSDLLKGKRILQYVEIDSPYVEIRKVGNKYLLPRQRQSRRESISSSRLSDFKIENLVILDGSFVLVKELKPTLIQKMNFYGSLNRKEDVLKVEVLKSSLVIPAKDFKVNEFQGKFEKAKDELFFDSLLLRTKDSEIFASGNISDLKNPSFLLNLKAPLLSLDEMSRIANVDLSGKFQIDAQVKGSLKTFDGKANFTGNLGDKEFENMHTSFSCTKKRVVFSHIEGKLFSARGGSSGGKAYISGSGSLDFGTKPETYELETQVKNLDLPSLVSTDLHTDFSGDVKLKGEGISQKNLFLNLEVDLSKGEIGEYPFDEAQGLFSVDTSKIHFDKDFFIRYRNTQAVFSGDINYSGNLNLNGTVNFGDLSEFKDKTFVKEISGRGEVELHIGGIGSNLNISGELKSDSIRVYNVFSSNLAGNFNIDNFPTSSPAHSDTALKGPKGFFDLRILKGTLSGIPYDTCGLKISLNGDFIQIDTAWARSQVASLGFFGELDNTAVPKIFRIKGLDLDYKDTHFRTANPVEVEMDDKYLNIKEGTISSNGSKFKFSGRLDYPDKIEFKTVFSGIQVPFWMEFFFGKKNIGGSLNTQSEIYGTLSQPLIKLHLNLDSCKLEDMSLGNLEGDLTYDQKKLNFENVTLSDADGKYTLSGYIPFELSFSSSAKGRSASDGMVAKSLPEPQDLLIKGEGQEFKLLYLLLPWIEYVKGPFSVDIKVKGTSSALQLDGNMSLSNGSLKIKGLYDPIDNLQSELKLSEKSLIFEKFQGEVKHKGTTSGNILKRVWGYIFPHKVEKGNVYGFGEIRFGEFKSLLPGKVSYDLNLSGQNIPLNYEYLDLSGVYDMNLQVTQEIPILLSGEIFFHQLYYKDPFVSLISPTPLTTGGEEQKGKGPDLHLKLFAYNNCWILNQDMNVEFKGEVAVEKKEGNLGLLGELETIRGKYFLLGTTFKIDTGTFLFDNVEKIDPKLDLSVSANILNPYSRGPLESQVKTDGETVSLTIGGTLSAPEVKPMSDSPYSQEEIIEFLAFGGKFSTVDTLGVGSLFQDRVVKSLGGAYGGRLLENLATRSLGVETFELRPVSGQKFSLWETELTVGKYVSEKIYLRYTRMLSQSSGEETGVEYRLSKHLFFEGYRDKNGKYHFGLNLNWEY
jgi:hypothetical protein